MFKQVPGNANLVVSLSQEFRDHNGNVVELPKTQDGRVVLEIYGKTVKVCPKWISLIAHFEMSFQDPSFEKLLNVNFVPANITFFRPVSSNLPIFHKPIEINVGGDKYRVVPNYSMFAVSRLGKVIKVSTSEEIPIASPKKKHNSPLIHYPSVYIYDPDKSGYRYVYVHRLVGMAWVRHPNNDYVNLSVVNHKNGNKLDFRSVNLEWCSFRDNNLHAIATGLKTDGIKCKVRDFLTGEIKKFPSKGQAGDYMGISKTLLNNHVGYLRKGKLYNGRYEFKLETDDSPWFYENRTKKVKLGRYVVTVTRPDGSVSYYHDLRDFQKDFSIWNVPNASEMIKIAKQKYPDIRFILTDYYSADIVQAFNVSTKEIIETRSIKEMSLKVGVSKQVIRRLIRGNECWVYFGYAFRYKKDTPWNTSFIQKDVPKAIAIDAVNVTTGEKLTFKSLRSASNALCMDDRYWLRHCVESETEYKGWKFKVHKKDVKPPMFEKA